MPKPIWLFDLDNTLHNASHAIFPAINANMNAFMAKALGDGETPADADVVNAARLLYWKRYGATLLGMIRYWYQRDGRRIAKVVSFFLFEHTSGEPGGDPVEVEEARWMALDEAEQALSYRGEREMPSR